MPLCKALQYSDQMVCTHCNLSWDTNDPEPPACRRAWSYVTQAGNANRGNKPEADPSGLAPGAPGAKMDAGKVPVTRGAIQYFPRALMVVASISKSGADKYSWRGWEEVSDGLARYSDALGRHITLEHITPAGISVSHPVTNKPLPDNIIHAGQAAWNALVRLELMLRETE